MMSTLSLLRPLASVVGRGKLSILTYHRIHATSDPLFPDEPTREQFDDHVGSLCRVFNVVPLDDALDMLRDGRVPPRAAAITFDDGYADNAEVALPILRQHGANATFFISTGYLDGGRMWNDSVIEAIRGARGSVLDLGYIGLGTHAIATLEQRRAAIAALIRELKYLPPEQRSGKVEGVCAASGAILRNDLMMRRDQVRALHAAGMRIGAHTVTHPILANVDPAVARHEIAAGREALQSIIGSPVTLFAYPNGKAGEDYLPTHVAMVRELGFKAAVSTTWGIADGDSDFFELPRIMPWDKQGWLLSLRLLVNLSRPGSKQAA